MDQQFVCIKDTFGNDRWYVGEELRLFPVPEIISLEDQVNRIRNIDLGADDVVIVGYPRSDWYGTIFNHLTNWGQTIDGHPDHPVFSLMYEELTQDTVGHLEELDQFLETHRGRQFCKDVADKCNVGNMSELRMAQDSVLNRDMLYRKEVVGDWKNWFTVAQNEEYKEVYRRKMAGSRWFRLYDQD